MSENEKDRPASTDEAKEEGELSDPEMEKVAGGAGLSVGTLQVRGQQAVAGLAKISDDVGTLSEFVPKLTAG
jgi:hypothetical protein